MKSIVQLIACFALSIGLAASAHAQRLISAGGIILDDNAGHVLTIETPQVGDPAYAAWIAGGPLVWKIPIPPVSGADAGFTLPGTAAGQTLIWDMPTSGGGTGGAQGAWRPSGLSGISGSGTPNTYSKFTGSATLGNAVLTDDGATVTFTGYGTGVLHSTAGSISSTPVSLTADIAGILAIGNGGTGANTAPAARAALGAAQSGSNNDITQLTGLATPLSVGQGGTGTSGFAIAGVLYGNAAGSLNATAASAGNGAFLQTTGSAGAPSFKTILDIPNGGTNASTAAGARTNLGLGTMATQAASNVAITGGTIDGTPIGSTAPSTAIVTALTGAVHVVTTSPYAVQPSDMVLLANVGALVITLPATPTAGRIIAVKNLNSTNIGISGNGHSIEANPNLTLFILGATGSSVILVGDGNSWWILAGL